MNLILTLLLAVNLAGGKEELQLNLKQGETYSQHYTSFITLEQEINGMQQLIDMDVTGGMDFKVVEVTADGYVMTAHYTSLVMGMNMGQGEMTFSSEGDKEDIFSKVMKGMVGKDFDLTMLKNGTISDIKNIDNIFNGVFEGMGLPEMQQQQILSQLKQSYGEESFRGNIEMITAIFPNNPVKVGDSWTNSIALKSGMNADMENEFTFSEKSENLVTITGESTISTGENPEFTMANGNETRYLLNGTMQSTYKLDTETNWIVEGKVTQNIKGKVEIKANQNMPNGLTMPMTMKTLMTIGQ